MEKEKSIKNGTKKIVYTGRKIYNDSLSALHEKFNAARIEEVFFSVFYNYKPFYVSTPTEREKESCRCIDSLNPHLILKPINKFRKSVDVHEYQCLTTYLDELSNIDKDEIVNFLKEKIIKKYIIALINGKLSATKEKKEMMSSIPEPQQLITKTNI